MTRLHFLKSVWVMSAIVAVSFITQSSVSTAEDKTPNKSARILFVTQSGGFKHGSVTRKTDALAPAERAMTELGISSGLFRVDCTQDVVKDFTKENLANYDIVMFYTTGPKKNLPIADDVLDYFFNDWLKQPGHGFIGAHSAADTYGDYQPYWDMIGGTFNGHPWGSGDTVTITVHDKEHPLSKPWDDEFTIKDEIYRFRNWQPEKVRVLMSLNMAKTANKIDQQIENQIQQKLKAGDEAGAAKLKEQLGKGPYHVPIAWVKNYGQGKVFHMSLGHNEAVWVNPTYMQSMLGGIKWILGYEKGDATPNPELSAAQEAKARADIEAAKAAEKK